MNSKTLYLEAARDKDSLKIGVHESNDVIWRYDDHKAPMDNVTARYGEITEYLNKVSRHGGRGSEPFNKLLTFGTALASELLPPKVREKLADSDAEYLILNIDETLVQIPWELLCLDQEFLCRRFSMGRVVKTRQDITKVRERTIRNLLEMWILANPGGDLPVANEEGDDLFEMIAGMNNEEIVIVPRLDFDISDMEIKTNIMKYDFVHFAGHMEFDSLDPRKNAWRLSEGYFAVPDVDKLAGISPLPFLIFANACQSARTEEWQNTDGIGEGSLGLPNAFLRAGVKHYIGTFWEVMDKPGNDFSLEFYKFLCVGETIGESIKKSRLKLAHEHGPDICWVSYILYGDPRTNYFDNKGEPEKTIKQKPAVTYSSATRGNPDYSLNTESVIKSVPKWILSFLVILLFGYGIVALRGYLVEKEERKKEKHELERIAFEFRQKETVRKTLMEKAEKQRERTGQLWNELNEMMESLPQAGKKTSGYLTLAAVFDSQILKREKEKMILFAINSEIVESDPRLKTLYRESFDVLLEELIRKIQLTPPEERTRPELLTTNFQLIVAVCGSDEKTTVLMQLVESGTSQLLATQFEELDNNKTVLEQKKELTRNILVKLGKIVENHQS